MSSERYDEQYVEIDGIKVLTYLVPDYDIDYGSDIWQYFERNKIREWMDQELYVDREHGWILGEIELPYPSLANSQTGSDYGLTWYFVDYDIEESMGNWPMDFIPVASRLLLYYRNAGVVTDLETDDNVLKVKPRDCFYDTDVVGIEVPDSIGLENADLLMLIDKINAIAAEYEQTHTEEGQKILADGLPRRHDRREYRYFTSQLHDDVDLETRVRYMAEDYERAEGLNRGDWWYLGVVAEWPDADDSIYHDSLWGVESDAEDYIEELRRELAQNVAEQVIDTLLDVEAADLEAGII